LVLHAGWTLERQTAVIVALGALVGPQVVGRVDDQPDQTVSVKTTFTNLSTGKTINANISGPAKKTESANGSLVFASEGLTAIALEPPDAKRFGLPTLFVSAGSVTLSFTAEGDTTSVSLHGHALINVCAALS